MKIALVRGAFLSPFELQLYTPLAKQDDFLVIGSNWQFYKPPIHFPGRIEQTHLSGSAVRLIHPQAPVVANRLYSWICGYSYALRRLKEIVGQIDILHAAESFFTMTYQSLLIKRQSGCRLVVTVSENIPHSGETHPLRRQRKRAVMREADLFIAITPTTRQMLMQEGVEEKRIAIIPNSISTEHFAPGPKHPDMLRRFKLDSSDLVVLFIGRFIPEKGIDEILTAIPGILKSLPGQAVKFCFVGEGPLEFKLRQAQRHWPEVIRLHPFAPYEEIPAIHRIADVFVMPSKPGHKINEQFGYVLAESMATGKAVVTTRCGSIPDVVGENGILIAPNDAAALCRAIVDLLASPEKRRRLGENAREHVRMHFDAERNAARLRSLYAQVLNS